MINAGTRRILKATAVAGSAAAMTSSAEAKMDGGEPDSHRVIFAPNNTSEKTEVQGTLSLNRKQLSKIAIWEMKDSPKDTLTDMVLSLGEGKLSIIGLETDDYGLDLAKDPSVQMAVYKKFGITMKSIKSGNSEMDLDDSGKVKNIHAPSYLNSPENHLSVTVINLKNNLLISRTSWIASRL